MLDCIQQEENPYYSSLNIVINDEPAVVFCAQCALS